MSVKQLVPSHLMPTLPCVRCTSGYCISETLASVGHGRTKLLRQHQPSPAAKVAAKAVPDLHLHLNAAAQ